MMHDYTVRVVRSGKWFAGYVEEIPGVHSQAKTRNRLRKNLKEAIHMVLEHNREQLQVDLADIEALDTEILTVDV